MEKKQRQPRYPVASITTLDADLLIKVDTVKHLGYTHEQIYIVGLETILKGEKS